MSQKCLDSSVAVMRDGLLLKRMRPPAGDARIYMKNEWTQNSLREIMAWLITSINNRFSGGSARVDSRWHLKGAFSLMR